jgi:hypothetical protein
MPAAQHKSHKQGLVLEYFLIIIAVFNKQQLLTSLSSEEKTVQATGFHSKKINMETKIQLLHPAGKHAVRMDKTKYDILSKSIFYCLKNKSLSHKELLEAIILYFKKNKIKFEGSVGWYMESVKLDLEAKKEIIRIGGKPSEKYTIVK